jgi:hypothetical protein
MRRTVFLFISFILSVGSLSGQLVAIRGKAPDYAGKELVFYTVPEPVSHQPKILAETKIGLDGNFILSFQTNQTIEVYADLEKYKGSLVVEPGTNYQITLPKYAPRTVLESTSPYFEPELYWFGISGAKTTDLNFLVRTFLADYNKELALHTLDLYRKRSADTVKAIVARLERRYPAGKNNYLNTLFEYSYGELEGSMSQFDKEKARLKYFAKKEVLLSHPAYQHLFNFLFSGYLNDKSRDIREKEVVNRALQGDFDWFVNQLMAKGFNREPAELVAVKSYFDGYYSNQSNQRSMLNGLRRAVDLCAFNPLKEALPGMIKKMTSLQEGSRAPTLLMKNQNNVTTTLSAKGKYVYLAFFRSDSKACIAELDSLVGIGKNLKTILDIIPVSIDANPADAIKLWTGKKYPWELSEAVDPAKVKSDYLIKSLPTFYLVSPDQKLVLSPALAPSHNFEALFLKIYRESRFRQ